MSAFSNRPFGVKRFQTIHPYGMGGHSRARASLRESAHRPFHHGIRERGGTICYAALPVAIGRSSRHRELTSSIVPRGTPFHHRVELDFLLLRSASQNAHAAAASRVQRNSVPSTQIRCMITANRRASATIAFFIPRRLAICIAHALSQDHFFTCTSMLWAAS